MRIAYIDQSHTSRMAKERLQVGPSDAVYGEVRADLEVAVEKGRLICPYSFWHVMETASYDNGEVRDEVCRIVGVLSDGWCFRWPLDIARNEVEALIAARAQPLDALGTGSDSFPAESIEAGTRDYFAALPPKDRFGALVYATRETGDIRAELLPQFKGKTLAAESAGAALRRIRRVARVEAAALERTALAEYAIRAATFRSGMHPNTVREKLGDLADVPTLALLAEIYGGKASDQRRKARPSDPIDLGHLLASPYCDVVWTERYAASLAEASFGRLTRTARPVFVSDARRMCDFLRSI